MFKEHSGTAVTVLAWQWQERWAVQVLLRIELRAYRRANAAALVGGGGHDVRRDGALCTLAAADDAGVVGDAAHGVHIGCTRSTHSQTMQRVAASAHARVWVSHVNIWMATCTQSPYH